jgi:hypothetical protein
VTERHVLQLPEECGCQITNVSSNTAFDFLPALPGRARAVALWLVILDRSCIIWLGEASSTSTPILEALIVGMNSAAMGSMTSILQARAVNDAWDDMFEGLTGRLSKRFSVQVFVSDQLGVSYHQAPVCHFIEESIIAVLAKHFLSP